jgi:hypothetical protein
MANLVPTVDKAFGKGTDHPGLHATLEITVNRGAYQPGKDTPAYDDNRGPRCLDLNPAPKPFPQYAPDGPIQDGSTHPAAAKTTSGGLVPDASTSAAVTPQLPNSAAEQDFIAALVAPGLGMAPKDFPGWGSELVGPLFRGTEVTLK